MLTLEEYKRKWSQNPAHAQGPVYDNKAMETIVRERTRAEKDTAMRYFWGVFVLQLIVYALFSHVIIRYASDATSLLISLCGLLLFMPFTVVLMIKFKAMAVNKPNYDHNGGTSVYLYVLRQHSLLKEFYRFKRLYETILIPVSTAILTFLIFHLYFPGGVRAFPVAAFTTFMFALAGCIWVIIGENRKYFSDPLKRLENILREFR